jgi:hypothetical protein
MPQSPSALALKLVTDVYGSFRASALANVLLTGREQVNPILQEVELAKSLLPVTELYCL